MVYVVASVKVMEHEFNFSIYEEDRKTALDKARKEWNKNKDNEITVIEVNEDIEKLIPIIQTNDLHEWFKLLKANKLIWENGEFTDTSPKKEINMNNITVHQLKCYQLLMHHGKGGNFEYVDFVRTREHISEEKAEIQNNILNYGMDRQVAELVRQEFEKNKYKDIHFRDPLLYSSKPFCVMVGWNEDTHKATLVDIGFYD